MSRRPPISTLFPYTPLFRSLDDGVLALVVLLELRDDLPLATDAAGQVERAVLDTDPAEPGLDAARTDLDQHQGDRKSTRLNSSHANISYAVFCLKKKKNILL